MSIYIDSKSERVIVDVQNMSQLATRFLLEQIHSNANSITPMKTGNLRARVKKSVKGTTGTIEWDSPYAVYQEKPNKRFRYTTPGTGPYYAEIAVTQGLEVLPEIVAKVGMR